MSLAIGQKSAPSCKSKIPVSSRNVTQSALSCKSKNPVSSKNVTRSAVSFKPKPPIVSLNVTQAQTRIKSCSESSSKCSKSVTLDQKNESQVIKKTSVDHSSKINCGLSDIKSSLSSKTVKGKKSVKTNVIHKTARTLNTSKKPLRQVNSQHNDEAPPKENMKASKIKNESKILKKVTVPKVQTPEENRSCNKKLKLPNSNEKENEKKSKERNNIVFEANEKFRREILQHRKVSPSPLFQYGNRFSMYDRASLYKPQICIEDPVKRAMKDIQLLTEKRRAESFYNTMNTPLAPKEQEFCTPDKLSPYAEAIRSMAAYRKLKLEKSLKSSKSTKKVTFDLNVRQIDASFEEHTCDVLLEESENRLTNISEKSEDDTPNSLNEASTSECNENNETCMNMLEEKNNKTPAMDTNQIMDHETDCEFLKIRLEKSPDSDPLCKKLSSLTVLNTKTETSDPLPPLTVSDRLKLCDETYEPCVNYFKLDIEKHSLPNIKVSMKKLYSPHPLSFDSQANENDRFNLKPEFVDHTSKVMDFAPIYTPLVYKNLAKSSHEEFDPIRQRLDFTDIERSTLKKTAAPRKYEYTVTRQRVSDILADQECNLFLSYKDPFMSGRYLTNPVAVILNEGDDMHFVPAEL